MCGITGVWDRRSPEGAALESHLAAMTATLSHRGPDDSGLLVEADAGVGLGHRRLAVIDCSPAGHQPMESADGRYVLVTNGEIYNFVELRGRLGDYPFTGHSDTEVLLAAICGWGLPGALQRANGMFALALWDRRERRLQLARDRFGEKPLFYGWAGDAFLFGSELKALVAHPAFRGEVDRDVLALYFRHNCVPAPYCIYRGLAKLPPASVVTLHERSRPGTMPSPEPYWSLAEVAADGLGAAEHKSEAAWAEELGAVLGESVRVRMRSDVPLGAFLSGGIDSSLVVALMQGQGGGPVHTFTMGFEDEAFDEAEAARAVASHLGTEHTEMRVSAADALALIPTLATMYDEPFADSSQVPQALLARLTRAHVTVALSGDGGDELFGGYNRYGWAEHFWPRLERVPLPARRAAARLLSAVPPAWWARAFARADPVLPARLRVRMPGMKVHKAARVLPAGNLNEAYRLLASHADKPDALVPGARERPTLLSGARGAPDDPLQRMLYLDAMTYLPDDILTKVDRATMAVALETRVPFLDPAVAALAWRLPADVKVRAGTGKWLLRQVLHGLVPPELVERPKAGFGIPLASWLRGPLRDWAEALLAPGLLAEQGYVAPAPVAAMWQAHQSGRQDLAYELWDVLMFQAWLAAWGGAGTKPPGA